MLDFRDLSIYPLPINVKYDSVSQFSIFPLFILLKSKINNSMNSPIKDSDHVLGGWTCTCEGHSIIYSHFCFV